MTVVTRFAPSPTGMLHIGSARTALFNWLYSRHHNGKYQLRIEDTDKERSTKEAISEILEGLEWMGIKADEDPVYQSKNINRHVEVAQQLLAEEKAYKCYCSPEELEEMRNESMKKGKPIRYDGKWRDRDPNDAPSGINPTIRFKAPNEGLTNIKDLIQGDVTVANKELDDMIILRADGTPTYMLSAVVDDHDMDITHVIRGDDHLANTPKQILVYKALGLNVPTFAHLPMILGADKKRLSKRHTATNVQEYRDKGYTSEAILNYLSLLGWNPDSEQEIFNLDDLIDGFNLEQVQKKPATFDEKKLLWVSGQHMAKISIDIVILELEKLNPSWGQGQSDKYKSDVLSLTKDRSKTLTDLMEISDTFFVDYIIYDMDIKNKIWNEISSQIIDDLLNAINIEENFDKQTLESIFENLMNQHDLSLGKLMQPVRFALSGLTYGPGIFDTMLLLGKDICVKRLSEGVKELS